MAKSGLHTIASHHDHNTANHAWSNVVGREKPWYHGQPDFGVAAWTFAKKNVNATKLPVTGFMCLNV